MHCQDKKRRDKGNKMHCLDYKREIRITKLKETSVQESLRNSAQEPKGKLLNIPSESLLVQL